MSTTVVTLNTLAPPTTERVQPALPKRLLQAVSQGWHRWRAALRRDAELRALQALSDATLRDIGMAERVWREPTLWAADYERSRW